MIGEGIDLALLLEIDDYAADRDARVYLQFRRELAKPSIKAAAFAWLAARRIDGLAGNLASVTGARGARVLGLLAEPRPRE